MIKLVLFLAVLCFSSTAFAGPDERVAEIRQWYDAVQKLKPSAERKIAFEAKDDPLSGDLAVKDFDGGWKSIVVSYSAGDHGEIDEHYYFKDGKLFFAYVVATHWRFHPDSTDENPKTIDTRSEDRYYYDGETCVRRLTCNATSDDAEKLPAMVAKLEQKKVEPGDEAKTQRERAVKLFGAKTAAEVLAAYE
ncbi:hypothetical protein OKA05_17795 [Luteolibacter arcticus]|uniref:Uncharacterized protein n=1 Tax=Luteolibacter arcticus TaxID=1581411 RepID=A0ABT3GLN4_9BACT|nr:hypothetical protein [Luteolibacter arcticus]MCW1924424.1 hypothetical protein [Luteolibacter arcticus]